MQRACQHTNHPAAWRGREKKRKSDAKVQIFNPRGPERHSPSSRTTRTWSAVVVVVVKVVVVVVAVVVWITCEPRQMQYVQCVCSRRCKTTRGASAINLHSINHHMPRGSRVVHVRECVYVLGPHGPRHPDSTGGAERAPLQGLDAASTRETH